MDSRLVDRAHIGGTWVYSRRTSKGTVFSTEKKLLLHAGRTTSRTLIFF
jgi:hypothetical protein